MDGHGQSGHDLPEILNQTGRYAGYFVRAGLILFFDPVGTPIVLGCFFKRIARARLTCVATAYIQIGELYIYIYIYIYRSKNTQI